MRTMRAAINVSLFLFLSCFLIQTASARDLTASLGLMPTLAEKGPDGKLTGRSIDLVKAMDRVYTDGKIKIEVSPMQRSVNAVAAGEADFHFPTLQNPEIPPEKYPFGFSSASLFEVEFFLYHNKGNKEISVDNLNSGKFILETERSHMQLFNINIRPSDDMAASLRKVEMGRIDGYIFSPAARDLVEKLNLKNVEEKSFGKFNSKLIIPKGEKGKEIDQILTPIIEKLKQDGTMDEMFGG